MTNYVVKRKMLPPRADPTFPGALVGPSLPYGLPFNSSATMDMLRPPSDVFKLGLSPAIPKTMHNKAFVTNVPSHLAPTQGQKRKAMEAEDKKDKDQDKDKKNKNEPNAKKPKDETELKKKQMVETTVEYYPRGEPEKWIEDFRAFDAQVDTVDVESALPVNGNHYLWCIVAGKGAGKSTLMLNALMHRYKGHYTHIYITSPSAEGDPKFKPLLKYLKELRDTTTAANHDVGGMFFDKADDYSYDTILADLRANKAAYDAKQAHYDTLKKTAKEQKQQMPPTSKPPKPFKALLLLDDSSRDMGSNSDLNSLWSKLTDNQRHLKLSIWMVAHEYKALKPACRKNCDMMTLFNITNPEELELICSEMPMPRITFLKTFQQTTQGKPFSFWHMTRTMPSRAPRLFDKFVHLTIEPNELNKSKQVELLILKDQMQETRMQSIRTKVMKEDGKEVTGSTNIGKSQPIPKAEQMPTLLNHTIKPQHDKMLQLVNGKVMPVLMQRSTDNHIAGHPTNDVVQLARFPALPKQSWIRNG